MKLPNQISNIDKDSAGGTSAPGFHLPDTLDWSCLSARIKNHVVVVPVYKEIHPITVIRKETTE